MQSPHSGAYPGFMLYPSVQVTYTMVTMMPAPVMPMDCAPDAYGVEHVGTLAPFRHHDNDSDDDDDGDVNMTMSGFSPSLEQLHDLHLRVHQAAVESAMANLAQPTPSQPRHVGCSGAHPESASAQAQFMAGHMQAQAALHAQHHAAVMAATAATAATGYYGLPPPAQPVQPAQPPHSNAFALPHPLTLLHSTPGAAPSHDQDMSDAEESDVCHGVSFASSVASESASAPASSAHSHSHAARWTPPQPFAAPEPHIPFVPGMDLHQFYQMHQMAVLQAQHQASAVHHNEVAFHGAAANGAATPSSVMFDSQAQADAEMESLEAAQAAYPRHPAPPDLLDTLPTMTLADHNMDQLDHSSCTVCLSAFKPGQNVSRMPDCKHTFHSQCVKRWLAECDNSCPLCRRPLT